MDKLSYEGLKDKYYEGKSPGTIYVPRFQNLNNESKNTDFIRGYGIQGKGEPRVKQPMVVCVHRILVAAEVDQAIV